MDSYDVGAQLGSVVGVMLITLLLTARAGSCTQEDLDALMDGFFDQIEESCSKSGLFEANSNPGEEK